MIIIKIPNYESNILIKVFIYFHTKSATFDFTKIRRNAIPLLKSK